MTLRQTGRTRADGSPPRRCFRLRLPRLPARGSFAVRVPPPQPVPLPGTATGLCHPPGDTQTGGDTARMGWGHHEGPCPRMRWGAGGGHGTRSRGASLLRPLTEGPPRPILRSKRNPRGGQEPCGQGDLSGGHGPRTDLPAAPCQGSSGKPDERQTFHREEPGRPVLCSRGRRA